MTQLSDGSIVCSSYGWVAVARRRGEEPGLVRDGPERRVCVHWRLSGAQHRRRPVVAGSDHSAARSRQRNLDGAQAALPRVQPGPDVAGPRRHAQLGRGREASRGTVAHRRTPDGVHRRRAHLEVPLPDRARPEDHLQRNRADRDPRRRAGGLPADLGLRRPHRGRPLDRRRQVVRPVAGRRIPGTSALRDPAAGRAHPAGLRLPAQAVRHPRPRSRRGSHQLSSRARKSCSATTAAAAISDTPGSRPWPTAATWWYTTSTGTTARGTSPARCCRSARARSSGEPICRLSLRESTLRADAMPSATFAERKATISASSSISCVL